MSRTRSRRSVLSPSLVQVALEGLEVQQQRLIEQIDHIQSLLGSSRRGRFRVTGATSAPFIALQPKKLRLSAAGRRRIVEAARKRWAEWRRKQKKT